ncbi:hypothetical protein YDYSY3_57170 [Paenibacillus chitinolyticus]|nr:hypothetical protein YDYSY3_57170 [Paenibacillus chitinolyticus]
MYNKSILKRSPAGDYALRAPGERLSFHRARRACAGAKAPHSRRLGRAPVYGAPRVREFAQRSAAERRA